jgi:hypothetical protein
MIHGQPPMKSGVEFGVKPSNALTVTALLSVLLGSFHLADDVVIGIEPGGPSNYIGILITAVYLYCTLMLSNRRWAHVLVLLFSIGGAVVPYLHMQGVGLTGGKAASSTHKFFWVWTIMALGVTTIVSAALVASELWKLQSKPPA